MKLPVVAIIGRPNVGKSTLFNRIVRRREAIVDDIPGITRDRKYGEVSWKGRRFLLVDTGGFIPIAEDVLTKAVQEQVQKAIEEAHALILLVDVTEGVTPLDQMIAEILRHSERKMFLAVNKVDNERRKQGIYEFYRLNLGDPLPISATLGKGVGDLLDKVVEDLPEVKEEPAEQGLIKLAVVGRPNVGKSSFINALLGEEKLIVTEIPGTTRDAIDTRMRYYGRDYLLIDTAGLRRKSRVKDSVEYYSSVRALKSIQRCDVALVLIDATEGLTHQDMRIIGEAVDQKKGVVLLVNKWDLVEKTDETVKLYEQHIRSRLKNLDYVPVLWVSAKTKKRIFQALDVAHSVFEERQKRVTTSQLNEALGPIIRENPPFVKDGRPLKIHYCTQVKSAPPVFAFFTNFPDSIGENYRRFLEKKIRENFGFFGVPLTLVFRKK